jgi:hypothetical protein
MEVPCGYILCGSLYDGHDGGMPDVVRAGSLARYWYEYSFVSELAFCTSDEKSGSEQISPINNIAYI